MALVLFLLRLVIAEPAEGRAGITLSGSITDSLTGEIIPNVPVLLYGGAPTETPPFRIGAANKFGFYSLPHVPAGTSVLLIRVLGYAEYRLELEIVEGKATRQTDIQLVQDAIGTLRPR